MSEPVPARQTDYVGPKVGIGAVDPHVAVAAPEVSPTTRLAIEIRALVDRGALDEAKERFGGLVAAQQRRASRIAYQYLRDAAEADEAVQDAFVKAFANIASYRDAWPFEVWFTRILINGCLDRRKARARRNRWFVPAEEGASRRAAVRASGPDPEARLLSQERRARLAAAIDRLDGRQRAVFTLCHYGDYTPRQVSAMTGINEVDRARAFVPGCAQAAGPARESAMIGFSQHLGDARLFDCYVAESEGASLDRLAATHLGDCGACAARYRELATFLEGLSADALEETDAVFTMDRLRVQQQGVARRLEMVGHPARAIAFPGRAAGPFDTAARVAPRWLAAAAVAGVIVGAGVGSLYDFARMRAPDPVAADPWQGPLPGAASAIPVTESVEDASTALADDDAFFLLLELARGGPQTRELEPFDAMTPRVRETSALLR